MAASVVVVVAVKVGRRPLGMAAVVQRQSCLAAAPAPVVVGVAAVAEAAVATVVGVGGRVWAT